jgi:hypothetical protein
VIGQIPSLSCANANSVLHDDRPPAGRSAAEMFDDYATDVGDQLGGDRDRDRDRLLAAARQACIEAAERVAYPGQWRSSLRAVELCQRAAELVQPVPSS